MNCRTDNPNYHFTPAWLYVEPTDTELSIEAEIESIQEFFVWSDDKLELYDKANEIVESSDSLKESLMLIVIQAIGTDRVSPHAISQLIAELQKTVKAYAADNLESE